MGAGRARLLSHTGARPSLVPIPTGEKRREAEVGTGAIGFTSQDCHWESQTNQCRGSSEPFRFFTPKQLAHSGSKYGLKSSKRRERSPSWGASAVFSRKLAAGFQGSLGFTNSLCMRSGVCKFPLTGSGASTGSPGQSSVGRGAGQNGRKTGNRASRMPSPSGLHQFDVCGSKIRQLMETGDKSEVLEPAHPDQTLQDGIYQNGQGASEGSGLDGQTRPQGRIPNGAPVSETQEPCGLPLEGTTLEVPDTSLWPEQCTIHLHKANETNSCDIEVAEYQNYRVLGRYADYGVHTGQGRETSSFCVGTPGGLGLHGEHAEECRTANPGHRVPGLCAGLQKDGDLPTTTEDEVSANNGSQGQGSEDNFPATTGTTAGDDGSSPPSSPSDTATLQVFGESKDKSHEGTPCL